MGLTVEDRSSNEADFLCILLYFAWRLWKSVLTLTVTGNTISGRSFLFQRVPELKRHRSPLTGSRWDKRWVIGRRTKPTFCVFPVLSLAVMGRCCDASRDCEYYFRSAFLASEGAGDLGALTAVDRKLIDIRWLIGRRTNPTFCVFFVFSVAVMEKCCVARREEKYYFRSSFLAV
jgi:hypothetical protein